MMNRHESFLRLRQYGNGGRLGLFQNMRQMMAALLRSVPSTYEA